MKPKSQPIFRRESLQRDSNQWLGNASVNSPVSFRIYALVAIALTFATILFSVLFSYSVTEKSKALILPSDGIVDVNSSYSGIIIRSLVRMGQRVSAGDAIAEYEPFEQADGYMAQSDTIKDESADGDAIGGKTDARDESDARDERSELSGEKEIRTVPAPIDGTIHELNIVPRMLFKNVKPMAKIAGPGDLIMRLPLSPQSRAKISVGDKLSITLDAFKRRKEGKISGEVISISGGSAQKMNPKTGQAEYQYVIDVKIVDFDKSFKRSDLLGQPAEAVFQVETRKIYQWVLDPMREIFQ
jgi:multidrug efflux pump subunit AcrA (membrane-fusion protein)